MGGDGVTAASVRPLLASLEAVGVHLSLTPSGDGLALSGLGCPPAELLDEVRRRKLELLEVLKGAAKKEAEQPTPQPVALPDVRVAGIVDTLPASPVASMSRIATPADPLPAHLAALIDAAHVGQLPRGAVKLSSGLVTDLEGYVTSWAACWPRDRAHILWRLEEAYAAGVRP